jgi:hypothetical protein
VNIWLKDDDGNVSERGFFGMKLNFSEKGLIFGRAKRGVSVG